MDTTSNEESVRFVGIRLTDAEIRAVREMSKVDAVAPAVVAVVRKAIEAERGAAK